MIALTNRLTIKEEENVIVFHGFGWFSWMSKVFSWLFMVFFFSLPLSTMLGFFFAKPSDVFEVR